MRASIGQVARGPVAGAMLRELSAEPGRPRYPLRWKSAKQRRFVMAKLRRERNLPYRRSHRAARGWICVRDDIQEGVGLIRVENKTRYVEFVQGDSAQPMHLDTGWPQAALIIRRYEPKFEDEIIKVWYKVVTT
jgi:hypothetical protein